MKMRLLFVLAGVGVVLGIVAAILNSRQPKAQPPAYPPAANPYAAGIYANGIVESDQPDGENLNLYPEVSGPITRVFAAEGARVRRGDPLIAIDESVQRATTEQLRAQAEAASALLEELQAEPRPENLTVAAAQLDSARASLRSAQDTLDKQERSYAIDRRSVSLDLLDTSRNAARIAAANVRVAASQRELTKAGAWSFDIRNQERQAAAAAKAAAAAAALLQKYVLRAPGDGVVLAVNAGAGSYVSPQGAYDTYTEGYEPVVVMGGRPDTLQVRCYVDEILVHRLPDPAKLKARMFIQGTDISVPLTFVRVQPYVTPKIELSDERAERVDVRVLPLVFRFDRPKNLTLYPGQLVDVYVAGP